MSDQQADRDSSSPKSAQAGQTGQGPDEKHDKVLHTRISPTLDREIKRRARGLGMSVSTVVRNVLLHTFDLVEDIVNDSANLALSIAGDEPVGRADTKKRSASARSAGGARNDTAGDNTAGDNAAGGNAAGNNTVIAWQEVVLNLNAVCERCNAILATGTKAMLGIRNAAGPQSIICKSCVDALATDRADSGNSRSNG